MQRGCTDGAGCGHGRGSAEVPGFIGQLLKLGFRYVFENAQDLFERRMPACGRGNSQATIGLGCGLHEGFHDCRRATAVRSRERA